MPNLEERISLIEDRNRRVEMDKVWERSWTRRGLIGIFTYLSIALYLQFIVGIDPWINAIIPTIGFLLSTLTLPLARAVWEKSLRERKTK